MTAFENMRAAYEAGDADTVISHIDGESTARVASIDRDNHYGPFLRLRIFGTGVTL